LTEAEHLDIEFVSQYPNMFILGHGSLMTVHFVGPEKTLLQSLFFHHMIERGIYMAQRGFIALNIELTESHVDKFVGAIDEFCGSYKEFLI